MNTKCHYILMIGLVAVLLICLTAICEAGNNPSPSDIRSSLIAAGQRWQIPPDILFGIAWQESGWRQFDSSGNAVISSDGGVGIMQLTGSTASVFDVSRLKTDINYNIDAGAHVLNDKWNETPIIGDNDRAKLENWYYAIWAYNGFIQNNPYPNSVLNWIANCPNGQWNSVQITAPDPTLIGWPAHSITDTPVPVHIDANYNAQVVGSSSTSRQILVPASQWLGGQGVDAYDNGNSVYNTWGDSYVGSTYVGIKYQCVELPQRLYTVRGWYSGRFPVDSAYQIYDVASNIGMNAHANGSGYVPVPGDMIVLSYPGTAGHVAVVDTVSNSYVNVVEQNWPGSGDRYSFARSGANGSFLAPRSGYVVRGAVHSPNNSSTNGGGENITTTVSESDAAVSNGAPGFWRWGTPQYWHDATDAGDGGHMLWTYTNGSTIDNMGDWRPNLPSDGNYEVDAYIPRLHATTQLAHYEVYAADGRHNVVVNQLSYSDVWVSLGTYPFNSGSANYVRLTDGYTEPYDGHTTVGFDTIKWVRQPDTPPSVTFNQSNINKWFGPDSINAQMVTWTLHDQGGGLGGFSQSWDNPSADTVPFFPDSTVGNLQFGYIDSSQRQGQHIAWIRAWNSAHSQYTDSSSGWFGYDALPPSVTLTSGQTAGATYTAQQRITWHIDDPDSGIYKWGQAWDADPGQQFNTSDGWLDLPLGTHTLHVHTWDNVGNNHDYTFGPFTYTLDPQISSVSLSPPTVVGGVTSTITINFASPNQNPTGIVSVASGDNTVAYFGTGTFMTVLPVPLGASSVSCLVLTNSISSNKSILLRTQNTTSQQDTYLTVTSKPPYSWSAAALSVGADDVTRLLWNMLDGTADLWNVNPGGYLVSDVHYGPFSGWSATTVSTGSDNTSRLVWSNTDGTQDVWRLDSKGGYLSDTRYGPYTNWSITAIDAKGTDTNQRLLWVNSATHEANIWITTGAGAYLSDVRLGPFSGWLPVTLGASNDNTSRLLWVNEDGTADVWKLDSSGNLISDIKYGPYSGWSATSLTVAPDGTQRLMWTSISGVTNIWKLDASGSFVSDAHFGPFAGYTSPLLAAAPDGTSRLGWVRNDGLINLWTTDSGNGQTVLSSVNYGPY